MSNKLSFTKAKSMLPKGKKVHTFSQLGNILMGCDMSKKAILELFRKEVGLAGEQATKMHHGLYTIDSRGSYLFVETKE